MQILKTIGNSLPCNFLSVTLKIYMIYKKKADLLKNCVFLNLVIPCVCQPWVNIATKKAGKLFEKE